MQVGITGQPINLYFSEPLWDLLISEPPLPLSNCTSSHQICLPMVNFFAVDFTLMFCNNLADWETKCLLSATSIMLPVKKFHFDRVDNLKSVTNGTCTTLIAKFSWTDHVRAQTLDRVMCEELSGVFIAHTAAIWNTKYIFMAGAKWFWEKSSCHKSYQFWASRLSCFGAQVANKGGA